MLKNIQQLADDGPFTPLLKTNFVAVTGGGEIDKAVTLPSAADPSSDHAIMFANIPDPSTPNNYGMLRISAPAGELLFGSEGQNGAFQGTEIGFVVGSVVVAIPTTIGARVGWALFWSAPQWPQYFA